MANSILITKSNGEIQEVAVSKDMVMDINKGDHVLINDALGSLNIELINDGADLQIKFADGSIMVLEDIVTLINENTQGSTENADMDAGSLFYDKDANLLTKIEFLNDDAQLENIVADNAVTLLEALDAAAAGEEVKNDEFVLTDGQAASGNEFESNLYSDGDRNSLADSLYEDTDLPAVVNPADTDTNEALTLTVTATTAEFVEDSTSAGDTVATSSAVDPDGGDITYSISDTTNYEIDANGTVTLTAAGAQIVNDGGDLPNFTVGAESTTGQTSSDSAVVNPADTDTNENDGADMPTLDAALDANYDSGNQIIDYVNDTTFDNLNSLGASTGDISMGGITTSADITIGSYKVGNNQDDGTIILKKDGLEVDRIDIDDVVLFTNNEQHTFPISSTSEFDAIEIICNTNKEFKIFEISAPVEVPSYEYTLALNANLMDTDGSESLSDITVENIPAGVIFKDSSGNTIDANADGSYTVSIDVNGDATAILVSISELTSADINGIGVSVASTEALGDDTATLTTNVKVVIDGTDLPEIITGTDADERIDGQGGADTILAGGGDDNIIYDQADLSIDGGTGYDTLIMEDDITLDFDNLHTENQISNIEQITLGDGSQVLENIEADDVLNMIDNTNSTDAQILKIIGDENDEVKLNKEGDDAVWSKDTDASSTESGFDVYTNDDNSAKLFIDEDIVITDI